VQAYKPISVSAVPKRKTIVRRKPKLDLATEVDNQEGPDMLERRETRDTTRARTLEVQERAIPSSSKKSPASTPTRDKPRLSQEQLLEEARIVEEWNKADLEAYIRYTELSEKERNAMLQKRRRGGSRNEYTFCSRSYIEDGQVKSEIKIVPPPPSSEETSKKKPGVFIPRRFTNDLLGIQAKPEVPDRSMCNYRYPYGGEDVFNTAEEYEAIRRGYVDWEVNEVQKVMRHLNSLLGKI